MEILEPWSFDICLEKKKKRKVSQFGFYGAVFKGTYRVGLIDDRAFVFRCTLFPPSCRLVRLSSLALLTDVDQPTGIASYLCARRFEVATVAFNAFVKVFTVLQVI
jgi:hypothetical protein